MFPIALVVVSLGVIPAVDPAKADVDPFPAVVKKLHSSKVQVRESLRGQSVRTVVELLTKQSGIRIVVRDDLFRVEDNSDGEIMERTFRMDANVDGMTLGDTLRLVLGDVRATYLVRRASIEVVPWSAAAAQFDDKPEGSNPTAVMPLVCCVADEQPLDEVVNDLARNYDQSVIFSTAAKEAMKARIAVSARMMNVPFHKAVEVLAVQADFRVVKKDNVYLVTTAEVREGAKAVRPQALITK